MSMSFYMLGKHAAQTTLGLHKSGNMVSGINTALKKHPMAFPLLVGSGVGSAYAVSRAAGDKKKQKIEQPYYRERNPLQYSPKY